MKIFFSALFLFLLSSSIAQKKQGWVSGILLDESEKTLPNVSISILGKATGITTNDSGYFRIKVTVEKAFALIFSYSGYIEVQKNFYLTTNLF